MSTTGKPIDLKARYGDVYRIRHDPAAVHEAGGRKDPWLYVILCRRGHIFPQSDTQLALWWDSSARLDLKCPALTLYQDGDEEKVYLFDPADFPQVAKLAVARQRRTLHPTQRQAAILRLQPFQKKPETLHIRARIRV